MSAIISRWHQLDFTSKYIRTRISNVSFRQSTLNWVCSGFINERPKSRLIPPKLLVQPVSEKVRLEIVDFSRAVFCIWKINAPWADWLTVQPVPKDETQNGHWNPRWNPEWLTFRFLFTWAVCKKLVMTWQDSNLCSDDHCGSHLFVNKL